MFYGLSDNYRGNIRNDATYGLGYVLEQLESKAAYITLALAK